MFIPFSCQRSHSSWQLWTILILLTFIWQMDMRQLLSQQENPVKNASFVHSKTIAEQPKSRAEFQVRTDIYLDENQPPMSSLQTLFTNGLYIEIDEASGTTTVVDPSKGRITLMDQKRKSLVHLEMTQIEDQLSRAFELLTLEQLSEFTGTGIVEQDGPKFLTIGNQKKTLRYSYQPVTVSSEISYCYGDFANWSCRVKALYYVKMPPQLRMQVNEMLMEQSQIPMVVKRIKLHGSGKSEELTARLIVTESLSDSDRSRVASIYQNLQQYKQLPENAFFVK